jgi:hypothetical protein
MGNRFKLRTAFLLIALIAISLWGGSIWLTKIANQKNDTKRLAAFAQRIANADHIIGTFRWGSVNLMIAGDDVKKVVRAASSAASARPRTGTDWKCQYDVTATFYRGTNILADIKLCSLFFLIGNGQPPFRDDTGLLRSIIYTPVGEAYFKKLEAQ